MISTLIITILNITILGFHYGPTYTSPLMKLHLNINLSYTCSSFWLDHHEIIFIFVEIDLLLIANSWYGK